MKNKNINKLNFPVTAGPILILLVVAIIIITAIVSSGRKDVLKRNPAYAGSLVFEAINVDSVIAKNFGIRSGRGVLVASEPTGQTAKAIGLKRGDIILALNDVGINDVTALMSMMGEMQDGARAKFTILRNRSTITLNSAPSLYFGPQENTIDTRHVLFVVAIFFIVFLLIFLDKIDKTILVSLGAITMVIFGTYMGFFDQAKAFSSINAGTLSLLIGMGFFAIFFEETNFFAFVSRKIVILSEGNRTKIILFLCGITYMFSMFVNNLSTILIIVPITLKIADELDIDIIPLLICEIIASNLGGASSMIGDFPNMLISSEAGLFFHDFIIFMFPVCFIQLLALFMYMKRKGWVSDTSAKDFNSKNQINIIKRIKDELSNMHYDQAASKKGLFLLSIVIIGFIFSEIIHINAPTIALAGGFILFAFGGLNPKTLLRKINIRDIIFFTALFVMVGAVDASGALTAVSAAVKFVSGGNLLLQALLILWISAALTSFLNAGPCTALFIPIIFRTGMMYPHNYIWWALSLGVLAGSCATLTGATAGVVTSTLLEDYKNSPKRKNALGQSLSFKGYAKEGVPIMFLFLGISTAYIIILNIF